MSGVGPIHLATLIEALMEPRSRAELVEMTGLHRATIARYIAPLHRRRIIRIEEYCRAANNCWVAKFSMNPDGLPDARKPAPMSQAKRDALYAERKKQRRVLHLMAGRA